jgi:endonuclease/exonuclease/phosphatase family metal-dependent hydrolase
MNIGRAINVYLLPLVTALVLLSSCSTSRSLETTVNCPDIEKNGQLNVLTLNTFYDAPAATRRQTWQEIVKFIVDHKVHVVVLQEAVLSDVDRIQKILGTDDSAKDLQRLLNERSPEPYELREAWETGVPLVLTTANAVLSRCTVTRHFSTFLPIESEETFEGVDLKITRNVQVAQIIMPGQGTLHVYNTHLCSDCSPESLKRQVDALLAFVVRVEGRAAGHHVLLGGDFNLDFTKGAPERAIYERITGSGFRDVYAEYRQAQFGQERNTLCRNGVADIHCTDGVSPLQGVIGGATGAAFSRPARLDYLFVRGPVTVKTSKVVFNPGNRATGPINPSEPAVSDHSGVYAEIILKP